MKNLKLKTASKTAPLAGQCEAILRSLEEGEQRLPQPSEAIHRVKQLNRDKEMLNRLKKQAENAASECKAAGNKTDEADYRKVAAKCVALVRRIDSLLQSAKAAERAQRRERAKRACTQYRGILGDYADAVLESKAFYETEWELPGGPDPKNAVRAKIRKIARELEIIHRSGGKHTAALMERYLQSFSQDGLKQYRSRLEQIDRLGCPAIPEDDDHIIGYKVLRMEGTRTQFARLYALMGMAGMTCSEEEDGMPGGMPELLVPDFDSFVCFDLESSGSLGSMRGDGPAEIIEIGAVRVERGEIVDHFSTLVNPGRRIVPRVVKLTGITDAMLKGKPSVEQAVRAFADFAKDSILVGHNIRSCDIPMIVQAGQKAGVAFENAYFDTYLFAEANKEGRDWSGLGLESLANHFGIKMDAAHRAWCDAEANAALYLKMREMDGVIHPVHFTVPKPKKEAPKETDEPQKKRSRRRRPRRRKKTLSDGSAAASAVRSDTGSGS